jgi:peptidyl-prolyl cis-trans isomerase SurA
MNLSNLYLSFARRIGASVLAALVAGSLLPRVAEAQGVLVLVNNKPITGFDVDQRIRILAVTERKRLDRKSALRELVDDQVKLLEARRIGYRVTEEGVDAEFNKLAKANRVSDTEFSDNLRRIGIQPSALRDKMRADIAWGALLRDQAKRGTQVSNTEVDSAVEERRRKVGVITEYDLRQVVFIVAPGGNPGAGATAANAARARFNSCETGFEDLRTMKDVVIKTPITRNSADLSPPLRKMLESTPVNRLTPASRTPEGIELVAVCGRKQRDSVDGDRSAVLGELVEKRITDNSRAYLDELRKKVEIKYR